MATSIWQAINEAAGQVVGTVQRSIVQIRGSQAALVQERSGTRTA